MAASAYCEPGDGGMLRMQPELMMDLLVDAELPETERAVLLRKLEKSGEAGWKDLSLRFLQRQTEKETVRQLMAGGSLVPVEMMPPPVFQLSKWLKSTTVMATAAGLLIAATSALITLYVARTPESGGNSSVARYTGTIPGAAIGQADSFSVNVPVLTNVRDAGSNLFPVSMDDGSGALRRSVVIQMDAHGNMVAIPVKTMNVQ